MISRLESHWSSLLTNEFPHAVKGEWIGCYLTSNAPLPLAVWQASESGKHSYGSNPYTTRLPPTTPSFMVLPRSRCLVPQAHEGHLSLEGVYCRVRVVKILKGPQQQPVFFFYGPVAELCWDPHKLCWPSPKGPVPFFGYTAKLGRERLRAKHIIPGPVRTKWQGILHGDFCLRWNTAWIKHRISKEAGLLWL